MNALALTLNGNCLRKAVKGQLGGTVVGLTKVAINTRQQMLSSRIDRSPVPACGKCGTTHLVGTLQVNLVNKVPFLVTHLVKGFVTLAPEKKFVTVLTLISSLLRLAVCSELPGNSQTEVARRHRRHIQLICGN